MYIFNHDSDVGGPKPTFRDILLYFEETSESFEQVKDIPGFVFVFDF